MEIILNKISKKYIHDIIYDDFNITFKSNAITAIMGPSGCGKTTLLNIICGLTTFDSGIISGVNAHLFSYVFDQPVLLDWLTVKENILFVMNNKDSKKNNEIADKYLNLVGLTHYAHAHPSILSSGMRQRVSIARAFAFPSEIILMDEPFKSLDFKLKNELLQSFYSLWLEDKRTVIMVTHDVDEALNMGETIYLLSPKPVTISKQFMVNKQELKHSHYYEKMRSEIIDYLSNK